MFIFFVGTFDCWHATAVHIPFCIHFVNAKTWTIKVAVSAFATPSFGGAPQDIGGEFFFETFAVYLIVLKESPPVVAFENVVG